MISPYNRNGLGWYTNLNKVGRTYVRDTLLLHAILLHTLYDAVKIEVVYYESTSAIGTKKLLIACRFFDNDKYERNSNSNKIE